MPPATDLAGWLAYLEGLHPKAIDMGLERVDEVRRRLGLNPDFPLITVGGTNGKGSTCAYLEAMLGHAGYRVGCYTSPHLRRYNERVRIAGREVQDADLVTAFEAVEAARGDTSLTYFEFGTLAAVWLFQRQPVDVAVLEVGLGGRLDAVNAFDADCAVVTAIDLDHQEYLGHTREAIGREKAGILRAGRPAVCSDPNPPESLLRHAADIGAQLLRLGAEIRIRAQDAAWECRLPEQVFAALPRPAMPGAFQLHNAAGAIAALHSLRERLPVPVAAMRRGLAEARQPGRAQLMTGAPRILLDVAHNPQAARALAANLTDLPPTGRRIAVLAMLADKDVAGVVRAMGEGIHQWHVAGLAGPRGMTDEALRARLREAGVEAEAHADVAAALHAACAKAEPTDIICCFGSFYTVAEALRALDDGQASCNES
ncbi:MAG TPA: bifunctional tetrahydrofolate synthase/dihydrofolate synthase [Thiobacillaceae bacterium]|nr:bifunctional tetrahydrofolate synthase/dihydrofolate synthase [Thiobacillaceae bacterium]